MKTQYIMPSNLLWFLNKKEHETDITLDYYIQPLKHYYNVNII